jgi:uncharacterized membrane protein YdbT with pleckstrin-like domain
VAFPKNLLNDHEDLVLDLRPHWFFMFEPTISLIGAILLGIVLRSWSPDSDTLNKVTDIPVALLILAVLGWFGWRYATWVTTNFVVTSDRVVWREGVLAKRGTEIPLERINTVFFSQSIFERMIGAGDLGIESAGTKGLETFEDVRKPSLVQNEIYRQMEANNRRMYTGMRSDQPQATPPHLSVPEQLEKLDELRRRGVINDQEFAAKKAQLLDRM